MKEYKEFIVDLLKVAGFDISADIIEIPPDKKLGDFAVPCFSLAKKMKKSPAVIAEELVEKLHLKSPFERIENNGPYLNFFMQGVFLAEKILVEGIRIKKEKPKNIMVEFSSPNTNKPLHLGHLRNIFLGSTLSNIFSRAGHNVIKVCLVNDRGVHICKSMLMYVKYGENRMPDKKPDHFVGDFYVMFEEMAKKEPGLEKEAQIMLKKWEDGDTDTHAVWETLNRWAIEGFQQTYDRLDVEFDKFYYESDIYKAGKNLVNEGLKKGVFYEEEGAVVCDLGKLGKKILLRKDGTSVYMTQDFFLAKKKFDDFSLDQSIYVVASEQDLHFQQLFKILELMDFSFSNKCFHLSYGMVTLPEGKMKSREGTVVDADDLIEEMVSLAVEEIKKRHELYEYELRRRAEIIAQGALRFYLLKTDPAKDMVYDPKVSISFEGETGPYVQYTYARIASILRKSDIEVSSNINSFEFNEKEFNLVKKLAFFQDIVYEAKAGMRPNIVCRYLIELCQMFNEYYHDTHILKADAKLKKARLLLVKRIKDVLQEGLGLLKIGVLEEM
ncbi:MAG: arginine--tRNA ligase [Candidatus Nanoarchaeia archaeon]